MLHLAVVRFAIRPALPDDAAAICEIIKRSVTALCVGDHDNDPDILARWIGSKTPELIAGWIADEHSAMFVAEEGGALLGVASILEEGQIALNYVLPEARFRGISRALVGTLEEWAAQKGLKRLSLDSTGTARAFYLALGYEECGAKTGSFGTIVYEMGKLVR